MKKIIEVLLRNKWLKLLSLALAIITWVLVSRESYRTIEGVRVPVHFTIPEGRFLLVPQARMPEVRLHLGGPAPAIDQFRRGSLEIRIDLRRERTLPDTSKCPQPMTIAISPSDVLNLPPNIEVTRLRPHRVTISLDDVHVDWLTVEKVLSGTLKKGLRIHEIYGTKKVLVRGPKSVIKARDTIKTLPIPIERLDVGIYRFKWPFDTSDARTRLARCLKPNLDRAQVIIRVVREKVKTVRKNVLVEIFGARSGFQYTVIPDHLENVEILGPKELSERCRLRAFVELGGIKDLAGQTEHRLQVEFSVAPEVQVLGSDPQEVTVRIRAEKPAAPPK